MLLPWSFLLNDLNDPQATWDWETQSVFPAEKAMLRIHLTFPDISTWTSHRFLKLSLFKSWFCSLNSPLPSLSHGSQASLQKKKKMLQNWLWRWRKGHSLEARGEPALPIHYLSLIKFSHPQNYKRINLCCFKPLRLWCLIAVVGNRQREKAQPHTTLPWFPPVIF